MYGELIFSFATAWIEPLMGLTFLAFTFDIFRTFLFKNV